MSKSTLEDLRKRRSVRSFKSGQITDEELDSILEAATWAPTGHGSQAILIVAVQNKGTVEQIQKLNAAVLKQPDAKTFYGAPTVVTVFADTANPTPVENGNMVIGNILNAAQAVGVGSCYIYRAKEVFESPDGKALAKAWGVPESFAAVGHVILGYAAETPQAAPRKAGTVIKIK